MKGIFYLWRITIKNRILNLKDHPAQLAAYLILAALLVFVLITTKLSPDSSVSSYRDINELKALMVAMFLFIFYSAVTSGLASGSSFFGLHDVNLLFTAPISPRKILLYGLVRQMNASLIASVFILFQAQILKERYNIEFSMLLLLLFAYAFALAAAQITAMIIYTFTNGHDARKTIVRTALYLAFVPLVLALIFNAMAGLSPAGAAIASLSAEWVDWYPLIGWIAGSVFSLMTNDSVSAFQFALLVLTAIVAMIVAIMKTNIDYYEDVLKATEKMHQLMEAAKEGRISDARAADKIRLRDRKGIRRGNGASVIFFKHMLENKRGGYFLFDNATLIQCVAMVVFALVEGSDATLFQVFIFSVFLQLFTQSLSRWIKELVMPYIFLIPADPFIKLVYACMESIIKALTDGLFIFIPVGFILSASPYEIAACILARTGFGILFTAGNILSEKVLGSLTSKGVLVVLYLLVMALLTFPGVIPAVMIPIAAPGPYAFSLGLASTFVWNTAIACLIIGLCRNILHQTDISSSVQ